MDLQTPQTPQIKLRISTRDFEANPGKTTTSSSTPTKPSPHSRITLSSVARVVINTCAVFALTAVCGLCVMALVPAALGYRPVVVTSDSMRPSLYGADIVITDNDTDRLIKVGTVIDFRTPQGNTMHRVVQETDRGFQTQGDANPTPDIELVQQKDVLGIGIYVVPFIGHPRLWIDNHDWLKLVASLAALCICTFFARRDWLRVEIPVTSQRIQILATTRNFAS